MELMTGTSTANSVISFGIASNRQRNEFDGVWRKNGPELLPLKVTSIKGRFSLSEEVAENTPQKPRSISYKSD
jgi:hypothetical protein